jgi:monofunctional biosynthetic peptidoglycan transglycosylase
MSGPRGFVHAWRDVPRLRTEAPGKTAYMRLRAGTGGGGAAGEGWIGIADLSPYALCAVVGAEDPVFFRHGGIWWSRLAARTVSAMRSGERVGAVSTITQQLARNLYLHEGRSVRRKLGEMLLARRLERVLGKARILELYVNVAEWGPGTWGIEDAARIRFGVGARALNPFQAVVLASLLPAPRAPLAGRNLARALQSQVRLLHFLYGAGVMTLPEWRETGQRVMLFAAALRAGRDADDALRELGSRPYPPPVDAPPTTAELLDSACGVRLRDAYRALLHAGAIGPASGPLLPDRWAGRLAG